MALERILLLPWSGLARARSAASPVYCSALSQSSGRSVNWRPAGTAVTFPGAPGAPPLRGHLHRPEGVGPFAAFVLLHGCGGLTSTDHWWADTLRSWGYVPQLVDRLGPPGETVVCDTLRVDPLYARMPDAYAARSYLASQPFAAAARIGLIGWSHGGITTLHAVDDVYLSRLGSDRFRAVPDTAPAAQRPLLILIGEEDDWTPATRCRRMEVGPATSHEFTLKVYPGAYHELDRRDPERRRLPRSPARTASRGGHRRGAARAPIPPPPSRPFRREAPRPLRRPGNDAGSRASRGCRPQALRGRGDRC